MWLVPCVVLVWLQSEVELVEFMDVDIQMVELSVEGTDSMYEGMTSVVRGGGVCVESI